MSMAIISGLMMIISGFDRELERLDEFPCVILAFSGRFRRIWAPTGFVL